MSNHYSRREFLGAAGAWTVLPAVFGGDPSRLRGRPAAWSAPVRIRGRVTSLGRGLSRVAVSDGLAVVATDAEGRFELVTGRAGGALRLTVPAGYVLPTNPNGTARCYRPIVADARGEMTAAFDLAPLPGGDDRHAFLTLADIQTQDQPDLARFRSETIPAVRDTVRSLGDQPLFAVADGDIMWDHLDLYRDYEELVAAVGVPFVQVVGNHDLDLAETTDQRSTATFERHFGPRYYSFRRGQVHYVVLDDVFYFGGGYLGYLDDEQLTWLAADLALVERGSPVVVFTHIPLTSAAALRAGTKPEPWSYLTNREALYRLLAPFRATVVTGHLHEHDVATEGGIVERNLGAVCGGWWTGAICADGTPNGYAVCEVLGSELRWRHQATGRPPEWQIRAFRAGADPGAPDEIVANVWGYEPGCRVVWYEDGERRGAMARRVGRDPEAVATLAGPDRPARRGWVEPLATGHLFYAPASRTAREIRIEFADRAGRVFTETVR